MRFTLFFLSVFLDIANPQLSFSGEGVIEPYKTPLAPDKLPILSLTAGTDEADVAYVGRRTVPVTFQYRVTKSLAQSKYPPWIDDLKAKAISREGATTCAALLFQQSIQVRGLTGGDLDVPLRPIPLEQEWDRNLIKTDQPGIERTRLSTCCDEEKCLDRCLLLPKGEPAFLEINAASYGKVEVVTSNRVNQGSARGYGDSGQIVLKYDPGLWPVMRIPCLHCPIKSCITNCSNGEYSTGYTDYSTGIQVKRVECKPCAPGTWNTCKMLPNCRWVIPDGPSDTNMGMDIHKLSGGPVGACYPCSRIRESFIYKEHYKGYAQQTVLEFSSAFRCPGLADPPENCPQGEFTASPDGAECVCKPGYYPSGLECVPCLPGHMCPNGALVRCPLHYYQQAPQATSCIKCGSTGDANGFFRCPRRGFQLQFCDPAKPETQTQDLAGLCVQCSQCKRGYATDDMTGMVGCYRDD